MDDEIRTMDVTTGEAALVLRCSVYTVYRRIKAGEIRAFRYTRHGQLLIKREELLQYRDQAAERKP